MGRVDDAHAAVAEFGGDGVRTEGGAWREGHGRRLDYSPATMDSRADVMGERRMLALTAWKYRFLALASWESRIIALVSWKRRLLAPMSWTY